MPKAVGQVKHSRKSLYPLDKGIHEVPEIHFMEGEDRDLVTHLQNMKSSDVAES